MHARTKKIVDMARRSLTESKEVISNVIENNIMLPISINDCVVLSQGNIDLNNCPIIFDSSDLSMETIGQSEFGTKSAESILIENVLNEVTVTSEICSVQENGTLILGNDIENILQADICDGNLNNSVEVEFLEINSTKKIQDNHNVQCKNTNGNRVLDCQDCVAEDNSISFDSDITEQSTMSSQLPKDLSIKCTEINLKKRSKSLNVDKSTWKPNSNKKRRELGVPYQGKIKKDDNSWNYNINRPGKFLATPCHCILGNKTTSLKCSSLTENDRNAIFQKFWSKFSWSERKIYIQGLTKLENVKRRRGVEPVSKRNFSVKYHLKVRHNNVRVCKKMFLGTLGMKESTVLNWIKNDDEQIPLLSQSNKISETRIKKFAKVKEQLETFLNSLPKIESHYCRSSSSKLYIEPLWHSTSSLYNFYKNNYCSEVNIEPVSKTSFFATFHRMNLAIYIPKKDLCDVCVAYETKNLSIEEYERHQELKKEARSEKEKDKLSVQDFVFTMDLQSVLLCPKSTVSAMYYKTKLVVHNFTVYDLKTQNGYCYLWNEAEGALTANEFSSILVYFLQKEVIPKVSDPKSQNIILYSDGCTGQNRNSILANAFVNLSMLHNVTIIQKYLQKGHTQMEVDSMHSCIEKRIRNHKINIPADYVNMCKIARKDPRPYNVEYLNHEFFRRFDQLKFYSSIRPGKTVGDSVVTNIKALKYTEEGQIQYKLRHSEDWQILGQRFKPSPPFLFSDLPVLYKERRKIKKEKYQHLQILKQSLLEDYHSFYDNLPYV